MTMKTHFLGVIALLLLSASDPVISAPAQPPVGRLLVGTSETSITPDRPVALEGFFHLRISKGVESPVTANVIAVETRSGEKVIDQSVFVSADLVHLPWEMVDSVRKRVARSLPGLDTRKIFISVTHTHAAPVVMRGNFILPDGVMTVPEYLEFFTRQVSDAIVAAYRSLEPASVAWGLGNAHVAYSRRMRYLDGRAQTLGASNDTKFQGPEGPEYQGVPMLFFFDENDRAIGAAINVWTPAQESGGAGDRISADFWHPVRRRLKRALGDQLTVVAWCGPSGDQMTTRYLQSEAEARMRKLRGEPNRVEEIARRIVETVLQTFVLVRGERHEKLRHAHRAETIRLPGWKLEPEERERIKNAHDHYKRLLERDPQEAPRLARPISWRAQTLARQAELDKSGDGSFPTELHVVRLGDVAIATNQFELFTEYGIRMLARSEAHLTFCVQLTGPAHYLPTAGAIEGGSYSAIPESCHAGPEGGQALVDQTVERIFHLFNQLEVTIPEKGRLVDGRPQGAGWQNLLDDWSRWKGESEHWRLQAGILRGEARGGPHHFAWTKKDFRDFELHAVVRMRGANANSGVGIRLSPEDENSAPGYQIDMGHGYWGCLWEEGGAGMLDPFPQRLASRLVRHDDWNHYYVVAEGSRIQAWLNGVRTIDFVHENGRKSGALGLELSHGPRHTILEVKTFAVRERTRGSEPKSK